jgi:hypothetical protein
MTEDDKHRISREWGICVDEIPDAKVIPRGVSGESLEGWRNLREANFRAMVRRKRFEALSIREGRA